MHLSFTYRLYPNKEQQSILNNWFGQARFTWNYLLNQNNKEYETNKKFLFKYDLKKLLPLLKKQPDVNEWYSLPASASQTIAFRLDSALVGFNKKIYGYPKFKSKHTSKNNITIVNNGDIKIIQNKIKIPKIDNPIRFEKHRDMPETFSRVQIIKNKAGEYYISFLCDIIEENKIAISREIGIDLGLIDFVVMSDGTRIPAKKYLKKELERLKRTQRQLSRKQKGSNNRNKAKKKLAKLHQKVVNKRNDFQHKLSKQIVDNYDFIATEDLKTKDLLEKRTSKYLNRSISDAAWSKFITMIKYKCQLYGKTFIQIDQFSPSSKTCHVCGHKHDNLKLSDREFICEKCSIKLDRDLNAAINILNWGKNTAGIAEIQACGDIDVLVSMKQEINERN